MAEFSIKSWTTGKTLFITGATGFLGKVLVEKLLRECSGVQKIYLLIRARDKFELFDRFVKYKENRVFGRLNTKDLEKLWPVQGDLSKLKIGICENDRNRLVSEVDVIIHSGASVKFNEDLDYAVMLNIRGTRELAELARKMIQLKAFIHVSTAFSNCHLTEIKEEIYKTHLDPRRVINICENRAYHQIEAKVVELYPNMYIFTKNLSEKLISLYARYFPVGIVRPSIITPAADDPFPGWMDSKNGPMGLLIGAASGLIRSAYGFKWSVADFIPVDRAANGIIAAAVEIGEQKTNNCLVYNMANSNDAPITWHRFFEIQKEIVLKDPFPSMMWYPGGRIHENLYTYYISFVLFQLIPALIVDFVLLNFRKRPWLVQLQIKAFRNLKMLSFFISQTWTWQTDNSNALFQKLNCQEKAIFNFKLSDINYRKYFENWHTGSKIYFLQIDRKADKKTFVKLRLLYCLELALKMLGYLFIGYVFVKIFGLHNIMPIPQLKACSACSDAYTSLKGSYLRK